MRNRSPARHVYRRAKDWMSAGASFCSVPGVAECGDGFDPMGRFTQLPPCRFGRPGRKGSGGALVKSGPLTWSRAEHPRYRRTTTHRAVAPPEGMRDFNHRRERTCAVARAPNSWSRQPPLAVPRQLSQVESFQEFSRHIPPCAAGPRAKRAATRRYFCVCRDGPRMAALGAGRSASCPYHNDSLPGTA